MGLLILWVIDSLLRGYKIQQPKPVKKQRGCTLWILPCEAGGAVSAKVIFPAGRRMPTALPHLSLDGCPCPCSTPLPGRTMPGKSKLVNSEWLRVRTLAIFFPDIKKRTASFGSSPIHKSLFSNRGSPAQNSTHPRDPYGRRRRYQQSCH